MKRTISSLTVLTILAMIAGSLALQGTLLAQGGKSKAGAAIVKRPGGTSPPLNQITGRHLRTLKGHSDEVNSVAFSPDGRLALSGSSDDTLKLWEVATGREVRTLAGHSASVFSVAFSPDGRLALSGSKDKTVRVWDVATGRPLRTLRGHSEYVNSVAFSPDGRLALSGSLDNTVRVWEIFAE